MYENLQIWKFKLLTIFTFVKQLPCGTGAFPLDVLSRVRLVSGDRSRTGLGRGKEFAYLYYRKK